MTISPRYFGLLLVLIVAANTYRLHRKHQRGESARYDGDEAPITQADIVISGAFMLMLLISLVREWARHD
jgi:hypothetical protein